MKVPYHIVIEPQEYEQYAASLKDAQYATIIVLPANFREEYRGELVESGGGIPARNFIWEHSIKQGAKRHWIIDDNIWKFERLNRNVKRQVTDGAIFKHAEDFAARYANVALAGFNYRTFVHADVAQPPFLLNTWVQSCILIRNDIPYRWRGKYNEDIDLTLRVLKDGWCTIRFNAFLADKIKSRRCRGGNTDQLYSGDGVLRKAASLVVQHPDAAEITHRFGDWHHAVDYEPFAVNRLVEAGA